MNNKKIKYIAAIISDIDGSMMPQGGPIDSKISDLIRFLANLGIKIGPATGKNVDYGRGLACGIGAVWDFIIGENGGQFMETIHKGNPPAYKHHNPIETGLDISSFAAKINLNQFQGKIFW